MTASKNLRTGGQKRERHTNRASDSIPHEAGILWEACGSFPGDIHFEFARRNHYAEVSRDFTGSPRPGVPNH